MVLVITEKHDAAKQIARLLSESGKPKQEKVYNTPIYRFQRAGQEWVTIGLRGHILAPDFPVELIYKKGEGWHATTEDGQVLPAEVPATLKTPPYENDARGGKRPKKPFMKDGVDIKGWKVPSLPYLIWSPIEKKPAEKDIIRSLKNLAKKADEVIIATDYDREGELIGKDALAQVQSVQPDIPVSRARYSAYTKQEIEHAFGNLAQMDMDLAAAGESRQFIDLIWGAALTRYLTMARFGGFGNVRSAGRVQTPTLALVVDRERERQAFVPEDYWVITALGAKEKEALATYAAVQNSGRNEGAAGDGVDDAAKRAAETATTTTTTANNEGTFVLTHQTARFKDEIQAKKAYDAVKGASTGTVISVEKKARTTKPPAPFNTTSLQAAAASIGLAPGRTMRLAESLYMKGFISYPRVDNTVYPSSLDLSAQVKMLKANPVYTTVCDKILSAGNITATRGKQQTTDHPPIYPTGVATSEKLEPAEWKLYNLVARRFLATLMGPATIEGTKLVVDVAGEPFTASGDVLKTPGFREAYPYGLKKDEHLPVLTEGDAIYVADIALIAKQTEPPARYSQGKLIQEMEKRGLGTKSTRASIIDRLFQVKYLKNNPVEPSQLGISIIEALDKYAPPITTAEMTSDLDKEMDAVSEGKETEEQVVTSSRKLLASMMDDLITNKDKLGEDIADAVTADAKVGTCPECGKDLVVKNSPKTRSRFIGCMGWPDCNVTYPVPGKTSDKIEATENPCPECGAPILKVWPFRQKPYEVCVNPRCETNQEPDVVVGTCSICEEAGRHGNLIAHKSETTGKRFIRCENYELCNVSYPLPQRGKLTATGETCPDCGAPVVEIETERGPWRICVNMQCPSKEKKTKSDARSRKNGTTRGRAAKKKQ